MKRTNFFCDYCREDISRSGPMPAFRITVSYERRENDAGFEFAIAFSPPLPRELHFCGRPCLLAWAVEERAKGTDGTGYRVGRINAELFDGNLQPNEEATP